MVSWPRYEPSADPLHQLALRHLRAYRYGSCCLWGLALLLSIGDVITTWVGVTPLLGGPYEGLSESVGLTAWVVETVGAWAFAVQKALVLGLAWRVSCVFPRPYPLGIALTVVGVNGLALSQNLQMLSSVAALSQLG